jgi:histidyl-tRNA synthetase
MMDDLSYPLEVAAMLRKTGLKVEVYNEQTKFKNKLSYANKQNIPFVIILGEDEVATKKVTLKNMHSGEQQLLLIEEVKNHLN